MKKQMVERYVPDQWSQGEPEVSYDTPEQAVKHDIRKALDLRITKNWPRETMPTAVREEVLKSAVETIVHTLPGPLIRWLMQIVKPEPKLANAESLKHLPVCCPFCHSVNISDEHGNSRYEDEGSAVVPLECTDCHKVFWVQEK